MVELLVTLPRHKSGWWCVSLLMFSLFSNMYQALYLCTEEEETSKNKLFIHFEFSFSLHTPLKAHSFISSQGHALELGSTFGLSQLHCSTILLLLLNNLSSTSLSSINSTQMKPLCFMQSNSYIPITKTDDRLTGFD